jgi:hypothetical protein
MDISKSLDPILKAPFANSLGGNTAAYETVQTTGNKMSGGKRRTKKRHNKKPKTKRRRIIKTTRRTRSNWSK